MRTVKVHPSKSIRCTENALTLCNSLNQYKRANPSCSFRQMAEHFGLSETNAARYYYGIHHVNAGYFGLGFTQVRVGAAAEIV